MRYNKTYHQHADRIAKAHGYEFAIYMGHYNTRNCKWLVFIPHENDTLYRKGGLLNYILVNDKRVIWQSSINFDLPFTRYDYLKRGRAIFRELERKIKYEELDRTTEEGLYWYELYASVKLNSYDVLILENDMCLFLQESERLSRKIEIVPTEDSRNQCDGWEYYLRLAD